MGSTVDTPFSYANQLLELAETALATTVGGQIGVPEASGGPGGRALVSPGLPTIDCLPWLSVHVSSEGLAATAPQGPVAAGHKGRYGFLPQIQLVMIVARCMPSLERGRQFPSVEALELTAQAVLQDMWAITDAARKADAAGQLFGGSCREVEHLGATALDPAGGAGGWTIRWRASVEGITLEAT